MLTRDGRGQLDGWLDGWVDRWIIDVLDISHFVLTVMGGDREDIVVGERGGG